MPLYVLLSVCIGILALCGVLDISREAAGISIGAFLFAALLVLVMSPFQIYIHTFSANAAALLWPLFWSLQGSAKKRGKLRLYCFAAWLPLFAVLGTSMLRACFELYFAPILDARVLCAEMLLWAAAVYTQTLFYINQNKMPVRER